MRGSFNSPAVGVPIAVSLLRLGASDAVTPSAERRMCMQVATSGDEPMARPVPARPVTQSQSALTVNFGMPTMRMTIVR